MSNEGRNCISTWLYLEGIEENGVYPQVKGISSTAKFHDTYRRCLVTFFLSARSANPDAELFLFSNVDLKSGQRKIDRQLLVILSELKVSFVKIEYSFRPPDIQKAWRNQFFVLDILKYVSNNVRDDDCYLILDSDIVWSASSATENLWRELRQTGSLTMLPIENKFEDINGVTQNELEIISKQLGVHAGNSCYAGGEFIALRGDRLKELSGLVPKLWEKYLYQVSQEKIPLLEEAHFLSILYSDMNLKPGQGNKYIRRIWTQVLHFNNRKYSDIELALWHLPAEKRFGIHRVANYYLKNSQKSWPDAFTPSWEKLVRDLGVTKNTATKSMMDLSRSLIERIFKR